MTKSELPRIGTPDDVAAMLHMSKRTVLRLASRGELPSVRLGKLYRFDLDAIVAMFAEETQDE